MVTGVLFLFSDLTFFDSKPLSLVYLFCQAALGGITIFFTIIKTRRPYQLFSGIMIFTYGLTSTLFFFLSDIHIGAVWPLYSIFPGVGLILVSCFKYKKLKLNYAVPALCLLLMGIYYFLFSFNIIKFSFAFFSGFAAPILTAGVLVIFILYYLLQKHHKEFILKEDESEDPSEEFPFPDEDL